MDSPVDNQFELTYLKWLLNNINYIIRLELHLYLDQLGERSVIDADFIRQYCLPDEIIHLKYLDFYIRGICPLFENDSEKIIHSFQIHPVFYDHQWTNVKCFFDQKGNTSYEHIFSSNLRRFQFFDLFM